MLVRFHRETCQQTAGNPVLISITHIMSYSVQSKKSGKTYFLHGRRQKLKGGQEVTLYFFAGEAKEGALDALPAGYEVSENASTGLPLLKKIR